MGSDLRFYDESIQRMSSLMGGKMEIKLGTIFRRKEGAAYCEAYVARFIHGGSDQIEIEIVETTKEGLSVRHVLPEAFAKEGWKPRAKRPKKPAKAPSVSPSPGR